MDAPSDRTSATRNGFLQSSHLQRQPVGNDFRPDITIECFLRAIDRVEQLQRPSVIVGAAQEFELASEIHVDNQCGIATGGQQPKIARQGRERLKPPAEILPFRCRSAAAFDEILSALQSRSRIATPCGLMRSARSVSVRW